MRNDVVGGRAGRGVVVRRLAEATLLAGLACLPHTPAAGQGGFVVEDEFPDLLGNWSRIVIDGDRALVGAESPNVKGYGHFLERGPEGWALVQTVRASQGSKADLFGTAVDLQGDRAVIGTPGYPISVREGVAYIFDRQPDGTWAEVNFIEPQNPVSFGSFGSDVALIGDALVVSERNDGGAALFHRLDAAGQDTFVETVARGYHLADDGQQLILGDSQRETVRLFNVDPVTGEANTGLSLIAADRVPDQFGDDLGIAVDVRGNLAAAGALRDAEIVERGGAAHVWERTAAGWGTSTKLLNPDGDDGGGQNFGRSVALGPGVLAVGEHRDGEAGDDAGAVHLFRKRPGGWAPAGKLFSPRPEARDNFGFSVEYDGNTLAVGDADGAAWFFTDLGTPEHVSTAPIFDVAATTGTGVGNILTDGAFSITLADGQSDAAVLEFDLAHVPDTAAVISAELVLDVNLFTGGSGNNRLDLFGYTGNGVADPADASQTSTLIGRGDPVDVLGAYTVSLDTDFLQQLILNGDDTLGLVAVGAAGQQFRFGTLESPFDEAPMLKLAFAATLPGDFDGDGRISQGDLDLVLLNWGADTSAGLPDGWLGDPTADGLISQNELDQVLLNWGNTQWPTTAAATVPEPTSFAVLSFLVLARRRR